MCAPRGRRPDAGAPGFRWFCWWSPIYRRGGAHRRIRWSRSRSPHAVARKKGTKLHWEIRKPIGIGARWMESEPGIRQNRAFCSTESGLFARVVEDRADDWAHMAAEEETDHWGSRAEKKLQSACDRDAGPHGGRNAQLGRPGTDLAQASFRSSFLFCLFPYFIFCFKL
jgi:hypothetical protein